MLPLVIVLKHILPGVLLISIQQVLIAQVHEFFAIPELLFIYVLLLLNLDEEHYPWVFISAFVLAFVEEYFSGRVIGITPLFFLIFSYLYSNFNDVFSQKLLLFPVSFFCYVFWIAFEFLVSKILSIDVPQYYFTYLMLIKLAVSLVLVSLFYLVFKLLISVRKIKHE